MPLNRNFQCPVNTCDRSYHSNQTLYLHVNDHLSNQESIPDSFFDNHNRFVCSNCNRNFSKSRRHSCSYTTQQAHSRDIQDSHPNPNVNDNQNSSSFNHGLSDDFKNFRRGSVIYRIPRGSRTQVASALNALISEVCDSNSVVAWRSLIRFPSQCLAKPDDRGRRQHYLSSIINHRINVFMNQPLVDSSESFSVPTRPGTGDARKKRASLARQKIEKGDIKGAIRIISTDEQLSQNSEETFEKLKNKHPLLNPNANFPDHPSDEDMREAIQCSENQVRKAILSFSPGSASGPDLLEPQHLKDLIAKPGGEAASRLLKSITRLCNFMLSGKVPEEVLPYIYGASLFALSKPNDDVRPIAVGTVYRRIASKVAAHAGIAALSNSFYPHQLGIGTQNGAEAIVHSVRNYLQSHRNDSFIMLKVDFKNAFNSIRRDVVLHQIKKDARNLFPFMWQMYGASTNLFYEDRIILSAEGMQQGDPLGPLGFSLAINSLVRKLTSSLNCWYLDDGCLVGNTEDVHKDLVTILNDQNALGLS